MIETATDLSLVFVMSSLCLRIILSLPVLPCVTDIVLIKTRLDYYIVQQMGTRISKRTEPGSGCPHRLPELQVEHDAARAKDSARQESVQ
jgi:hypothetical protein